MNNYSVLMSVYDREKPENLCLSINSILNQTIPPDEIVIVKDGILTSELDEVLEQYSMSNPIFNVIGYKENRGLGWALNYGLNYCRNELVARMDSDDIARHDRCEKQLKEFEKNSSLAIIGGDIAEFMDSPNNIMAYRKVPTSDSEIKEYMKTRCPLNHMTVMFKKSAVIKAGNYQDCFWNEDYYLWIRMMEQDCIFANTGDVLVNVRIDANMYLRRGGKKYFYSELKLQKYMLNNQIIGYRTYVKNVGKRIIVQILLPNRVRGWVFRKFARE